ncbi:MAG: kelch repeat-containing protein, partial [Armatimonadota bacterium]|nr:kelch repeat-containing protein [Armatimonadota bacterium]
RWERLAPLPHPRSGVAAAVLRDRIYVFGGEEVGRVFADADAYDPEQDRWVPVAPMPTPRHGTGAAAVGEWIYVPGGGLTVGGSRPSAVHEAFRPD